MVTRFLSCVIFCVLGVDAGVTQTQRHVVTGKRQTITLSCKPMSGHNALFWYRQFTGQGLKLLIYFNNQQPIDDSGMPKERFSAEMLNGSFSTLKIQQTEPEDSAVYFCASSLATVLQDQALAVQKPSYFPLSVHLLEFSEVVLGSSHHRKNMGLVFYLFGGKEEADHKKV
ncbi:T-cell receptor beta chain V region YT35 [Fukomys damarensis]|nr:T-cell receptor beta chain V region YT35 [Fukomys damarensis]